MNGGDKPLSSVPSSTYHNRSFSGDVMGRKSSMKVVSTHSPGNAREQASRDEAKSKNKSNRSRSYSNDIPFDAYGIGLSKHPLKISPSSTCPHSTNYNKDDSKIPMTSKFSSNNSSEDAVGVCSPPYFDEEVDANSVAAASAAAVRKAIEEAQARIRIAKEIMERKEGLQNYVKLRFNNVSKMNERRKSTMIDKANKIREEEWEKCKVDIQVPVAGHKMQMLAKCFWTSEKGITSFMTKKLVMKHVEIKTNQLQCIISGKK